MRPVPSEQVLRCTTCGSRFRFDGTRVGGPATVSLDRWAIGLAGDGAIVVDLARRFRHERGEWDRPAAFLRR